MPRIVGVVDADVALAEEQRLGIAVVLHRLVEVKVILREVREDADGVLDPVHAVELERVGRNLHHRVRAARVRHAAQQPLQLEGFRASCGSVWITSLPIMFWMVRIRPTFAPAFCSRMLLMR